MCVACAALRGCVACVLRVALRVALRALRCVLRCVACLIDERL